MALSACAEIDYEEAEIITAPVKLQEGFTATQKLPVSKSPQERLQNYIKGTISRIEKKLGEGSDAPIEPFRAAAVLQILDERLSRQKSIVLKRADGFYPLYAQLLANEAKNIKDCLSGSCFKSCQTFLGKLKSEGSSFTRPKSDGRQPVFA